MVDFDKNGWFVGQIIRMKINHKDNHIFDKLEQVKYDKSKYIEYMHTTHKKDIEKNQKIVQLSETRYKGKKFEEWNKKDSGALAVVFRSSKSNKLRIIKILIPKLDE